MSNNLQLLREVTLAENLDPAACAANQAGVGQLLDPNARTIFKPLQLPNIDYLTPYGETAIAETAFWQPTKQRYLSALIQ